MFSDLETAVLAAMCDHNPEIADDLRAVLKTATVTGRENTGKGFFTGIRIDSPPSPPPYFGGGGIECPNALLADLGDYTIMDFTLWLEDGLPHQLEGYLCYGGPDLKTHDLMALKIKRLGSFPPPRTG